MMMMNRIQKICRFCADIIYPNRCPCCSEFIVWNEYLCPACEEIILIDTDILCTKCGKTKEECICASLLKYDEAVAISFYEEGTKDAIIALKRSYSRNFGYFSGEKLGLWINAHPEWKSADGIVPVPMSRLKKLARGYNQAEIIAKAVSKTTGIPVMKDCIIKRYGFSEQHTLSAEERAKNTESFIPAGRDLEGMKLILCDDILTTGNTLSRCAEILKMCGAKKVYAAAAATVRRKREEQTWQQ